MIRKYKALNTQKHKLAIIYLLMTILIGSLIGSISLNSLEFTSDEKILTFVDYFFKYNSSGKEFSLLYFLEIFFKNIKYLLAIWFLGFLPIGVPFIYFIILIKGFSIGFTSSMLINEYSLLAIKYIFQNYTINNFIFIPILIYLAYSSILFTSDKNKSTLEIYIRNGFFIAFITFVLSFLYTFF